MARKGHMARLRPDPVPEPLWGVSAYRLLGRGPWKQIRSEVLAGARGRCAICGAFHEKRMVCHEVWRYSERHKIATLTDLKLVCPDCNLVEHIGFASLWIQDGDANARRHMA